MHRCGRHKGCRQRTGGWCFYHHNSSRQDHGRRPDTGGALARPGDYVIVTGDIGRHGCTILLARDDYGIEADVTSDCAPLEGCAEYPGLQCRISTSSVTQPAAQCGTVLYEIAGQSGVGFSLDTESIPVEPGVKGVPGMLGLEPLYLACEGRLVIIAPPEKKDLILETSVRALIQKALPA